jgi:ATP-dependent Lhr-like helicase
MDNNSGEIMLKRRKRAWEYYYQNLSTIPDTRNYKIIDTVSNKHVANLDAEFIALHGSPGTSFICKGQAWRILEMREGKVFAEPTGGVDAAIPAWEGELIPVPLEIAQDVGALRREIKDMLESKIKSKTKNWNSKDNTINYLMKNYPFTIDTAKKMIAFVKVQKKHTMPDDRTILIECGKTESMEERGYGTRYMYPTKDYWVVIHTCWGSLVNETVGRALTAMLSNRLGSVGLRTDPYKIVLKVQSENDFSEAIDLFRTMDPKTLPDIVKLSLRNSELFRWRFLHVAKRLGIIDRDADYGKGYLKKVVESYLNTPASREALNEIEQEKLDIPQAVKVMELVNNKKINIVVRKKLSPLSESGVVRKYEVVASERPENEIFEVFKQRLMGTRLRLLCCHCGFGINYEIKDLPEDRDIKCKNCDARLVSVIKPYDTEKERLLKKFIAKKPLEKEELEIVNELMDTASMVASSGKDAVIALAGRGVGPRSAARIMLRQNTGEELLKDILKAEQTFSRTKSFWKD